MGGGLRGESGEGGGCGGSLQSDEYSLGMMDGAWADFLFLTWGSGTSRRHTKESGLGMVVTKAFFSSTRVKIESAGRSRFSQ